MAKLTLSQYMQLMVLFILGGGIVINQAASVGTDVWILYLVSLLLGILVFLVYCRLLKLNNYSSLPMVFENCLGKWGGKTLTLVYAVFFLSRTQMSGDIMTVMAADVLMRDAPYRLILAVILFAALYGCYKGITPLGRAAEVFLPISLIALLPFLVTSFTVGSFQLNNLRPQLSGGPLNLWQDIAATTMYPYTEMIVFAALIVNLNHKEKGKAFCGAAIALAMGTFILIFIYTSYLTLLGKQLALSLKYPFYNAMMLTGVKGVLDRLDPLGVLLILVCGYFKGTLYLYMTIECIHSLSMKLKRNWIIGLMGILIFAIAPRLNIFYDKFLNIILPFWIMPAFHLVIPFALWGLSEWKSHRERNKLIEILSEG